MAFQCTVATPEGLLYDGTITGAILPAHDGQLGIQTGRAPILLKIGAGALRLHVPSAADLVYFIAGGVAQMKDDVLTILSDEAKPIDQLDVDSARQTVAELSTFPQTTAAEFAARERKLNRARAVLQVTASV